MSCEALLKAIDAYIAKEEEGLGAELGAAGFADAEETVREIASLEDRIAQALAKETAYILGAAKRAKNLTAFAAEWDGIKLGDNIDKKLREIFSEGFAALIPKLTASYIAETDPELAAASVAKALNVSLDNEAVAAGITKRTTAWAESWSSELGELMKLNSHDEIEKILVTGLREGQGVAEFARAIQDSGIRDEYCKARRVALTEALRAHSVAQQEAFTQNPAVEEKEWRHTGSYRNAPRENHVAMDGERVPVGEAFTLVGLDGTTYYPMYPRDSSLPPGESVNCHCLCQPRVDKDILGLSLDERRGLQAKAIAEDDGEWEKELDARNRAKAGIESDVADSRRGERTELGRIASYDRTRQVKYMGGRQKWALYESGVIKDDDTLQKVKSSTLKELNENGIITIKTKIQNHSNVGSFTPSSGRLKSGGHGQANITELNTRGTRSQIEKTYSNGVRIGGVENHKTPKKRIGTTGQSWFPDSWGKDDILVAGTYVADTQKPIIGNFTYGTYKGVRVGLIFDPDGGGTIFPDGDKQPFNGGWEVNDIGK
jgi:hypothetical protein